MIEVLKQALEFIERVNKDGWILADFEPQMYDTITSLRKAIQEEALRNVQRIGQEIEQEPIANLEIVDLGDGNKHFDNHWLSDLYSLPCGDYLLYTHPIQRTWVGLTDEEMYLNCPNWLSQEQCKAWIQQIEAKLKHKNGFSEEKNT